jgi:transposase InsO family protein
MTIATHYGRPGTPTDQAHVESFFGHLKTEWPHLTGLRDPQALDHELARIRGEYRGRDGRCWPPPAQIPACASNALGS